MLVPIDFSIAVGWSLLVWRYFLPPLVYCTLVELPLQLPPVQFGPQPNKIVPLFADLRFASFIINSPPFSL
jgi:hypothetical protein